jgi:hypothetical protein
VTEAQTAGAPLEEVERAVLEHDWLSNGEREVSASQAETLVRSGCYRRSSGAPYDAIHYRRSLEDGSCLHLVVDHGRRRLHHDAFDPHAGLFALGMHLAHDARFEAMASTALAVSVVKLLAR